MNQKLFVNVVLFLMLLTTSCSAVTPSPIVMVIVVTATSPAQTDTPQPSSTSTSMVPSLTVELSTVEPTQTHNIQEATVTDTETASKGTFRVQSVDVMKLTQDRACDQPDETIVNEVVDLIAKTGATHVAISMPLNDFTCDNNKIYVADKFVSLWVTSIRAHGMHVWFRMKDTSAEGFYNTKRNLDTNFQITTHQNFITRFGNNLIQPGDIYTINPEPQNMGLAYINCFPDKGQECAFNAEKETDIGRAQQIVKQKFNDYLVAAKTAADASLAQIGLENGVVETDLFGVDGFVGWGDENPGWKGGIITPETLKKLNNRLIADHYFKSKEPISELKKINDELMLKFGPEVKFGFGEWGPTDHQDPAYVRQVLEAARDAGVDVFNWWQAGPGGNERLFDIVDGHVTPTPYPGSNETYYDVLTSIYSRK